MHIPKLLQNDLDSLVIGANQWSLEHILSQCKVIHFGKKTKICLHYSRCCSKSNDPSDSNFKRDLGIQVSNNLSWQDKVSLAVSKVSRSLGLIKSTFKNIDLKTFKLLYSSMLRFNLKYGVNVWNGIP